MDKEYSAGIMAYGYRGGRRLYLSVVDDGFYGLPKGHIEKGETEEMAAIRETKEECGLELTPMPHFKCQVNYINRYGVRKYVTVFIRRVGSVEKLPVAEKGLTSLWLSYEELKKRVRYSEQKRLLDYIDSYIDKIEELERINADYRRLPSKAKDWNLSRRLVPGEGFLDSKLMFVGQAPGANEDEKGRPFIGISGRLLTGLMSSVGIDRNAVYITSVVQFFPPRNRIPTDEEIGDCKEFLSRQIELVDPKIIVLLGSVAAKWVGGITEIMKNHGTALEKNGRVYFVTLHPAAIVRLKKYMPIAESDFRKLKRIMGERKISTSFPSFP